MFRMCCRTGLPRWQLLTRTVLPVPAAPRMSGRGRGCTTPLPPPALLEAAAELPLTALLEEVDAEAFMSRASDDAGWNDDMGRSGLLLPLVAELAEGRGAAMDDGMWVTKTQDAAMAQKEV